MPLVFWSLGWPSERDRRNAATPISSISSSLPPTVTLSTFTLRTTRRSSSRRRSSTTSLVWRLRVAAGSVGRVFVDEARRSIR